MTARDIALRQRARRRKLHSQRSRRPMRPILAALVAVPLLLLFVSGAVMGAAALFGAQQYNAIAETVRPAEEVVNEFSRGGAKVYDRNGTLLYQFVDRSVGMREPVALHQIAPVLIDATVAVEDPDFWDNPGINIRGTLRAGIENFTPFLGNEEFFEGTGGSSITQQLARNVYMTYEQRQERTVERKFREMVIALELTERYSKAQILEWYLNLLPYGGIYVGIEAAAEGFFGKTAAQLTLPEAAVLAGIPQAPARYNPFGPGNLDPVTRDLAPASPTKARQRDVLELMVRDGKITQEQAEAAYLTPLRFREEQFEIEAPHFVLGRVADEIIARYGEEALYRGGLSVTTSLDLELQHIAEEIVENNVAEFGEPANLHNGAYLALDPQTGQILVYVGSRDYFNSDIEGKNDNILAPNSPGSTLKPFTYLTAFTKGWGTGTAILDTPMTIKDEINGDFTPRNPGTGFQGPVTVAIALGNSFNIPAIKTMQQMGVAETIEMYRRFGYTTLDDPSRYGPSLTTGGGEVTLMDQAIAYQVLAAGGVMRGQEAIVSRVDGDERQIEPVALLRVADHNGEVLYEFTEPVEERIVDEAYTYMISSILSDPQNTCITYSTCGALALPNGFPSAAKTGTSEPFDTEGLIGETWTMGYTPHLVSGIWAGNADNDPIQGISSTTVSLRAWKEFMVAAIEHLDLPEEDFERPSTVVERQVCWPSGRLPTSSCPSLRRYTSLYAAEVLEMGSDEAPDMYDSWWRGGRLVFPAQEISGWSGLSSWAARYGVSGYVFGFQPRPTPSDDDDEDRRPPRRSEGSQNEGGSQNDDDDDGDTQNNDRGPQQGAGQQGAGQQGAGQQGGNPPPEPPPPPQNNNDGGAPADNGGGEAPGGGGGGEAPPAPDTGGGNGGGGDDDD